MRNDDKMPVRLAHQYAGVRSMAYMVVADANNMSRFLNAYSFLILTGHNF